MECVLPMNVTVNLEKTLLDAGEKEKLNVSDDERGERKTAG
jgi:hypothetical protein